MAHWTDVGGTLGGMTTDIFSEGLQLPFLKLHERGRSTRTSSTSSAMNVRLPSRAMGDLRAQVTAVRTGERAFLQLIARYGREPRAGGDRRHHGPARRRLPARARAAIPDGVYEAESFMDDDGITVGKQIPIRVQRHVKGDEMTIDLTDVARRCAASTTPA